MARILILDDDRDVCAFLEGLLADAGREFVSTSTPDDAIARIRNEPFDVLISDINLNATRTGLDVLRAFKAEYAAGQVLLISGFGTLETAIEAMRACHSVAFLLDLRARFSKNRGDFAPLWQRARQSAGSPFAPKWGEGEAHMKYPLLSLTIVSLLVVPALHAAQGPQAGQRTPSASAQASKPTPAAQARSAKTKPHVVNADFVAYDAKGRKMTIKDDKGQTSTVPLDRAAIREVDRLHLKSGDHMILTFRDSAKGKHQSVSDIKLANPKA